MNGYMQPGNPKQVIMVYPSIGYAGGVERVMAEVLKFLAENGIQIHAICSDIDPRLQALCHSCQPLPLKKSKHRLIDLYFQAQWMYRSGKIARSFSKANTKIISAPCAVFAADIVMAGSCHLAAQYERLTKGSFKWLLNPRHWFYIFSEGSIFFGNNPQILVPSQRTQSEINRFYRWTKGRTDVVPHGVDLEVFSPSDSVRAEVTSRLGINKDAVILLTVTNEIKRKGCFQVLESLRLIQDPKAQFHYIVVGRDDPSDFLNKAKEMGLSEVVSVLPGAQGQDLAKLYQGADLFILPTEYESFGLVGMEALACGLPVLCTRVGGLEDYVTDGIDGIFVERNGKSIAAGLEVFLGLTPHQKIAMKLYAAIKSRSYKWKEVLHPILKLL